MSVAFAAEVVVAYEGNSTVAFAREEEKEQEGSEKKSSEDKFNSLFNNWLASPLSTGGNTNAASRHEPLPAGYYLQLFTPPDTAIVTA